jgi:hypothetical protein
MTKAPTQGRSSLNQVPLPLCDAVYCIRKRKLQQGCLKFVNYEQVYNDFGLTSDDDLMARCLVVAARSQEVHVEKDEEKSTEEVTAEEYT